METRFDRELNQLSDDEDNNVNSGSVDDNQEESGSENEANEEFEYDITNKRGISVQSLPSEQEKG
jgi:hypothetical protein